MADKSKYYVYVGYYEVYITTKKMEGPATLSSWHKTAENAEKRALREYPSATFLYDEDSLRDLGYGWVIEDYMPVWSDDGVKLWQC